MLKEIATTEQPQLLYVYNEWGERLLSQKLRELPGISDMSRIGWEDQREDLGQLAWMARPMDLFPDDFDKLITVELGAVHYFPNSVNEPPKPRDHLHWMIRWYLANRYNTPYFRVIEIRFESQDTSSKISMGEFPFTYTNWGPVTRSITSGTHEKSLWLKLGSMSFGKGRY